MNPRRSEGTHLKPQNLMGEDWDNMIILDACRFDHFKELNPIKGKLQKRVSKGSATPEWLYRTFQEKNDIVYFSANPYINSFNKPLSVTSNMDYEWSPNGIFKKIYNAWLDVWNDQHSTVLPKDLSKYVIKRYRGGNRVIVHFIQPHLPFIQEDFVSKFRMRWKSKEIAQEGMRINEDSEKNNIKNRFIMKTLTKIPMINTNQVIQWHIKRFTGVPPHEDFEKIWRMFSRDQMISYYKDSLKVTLENVEKLLNYLPGKTVISSDHGECFGEHWRYGHKNEFHVPTLINVPWLKVK